MPTYQYECSGCGKARDEFRHIDQRDDAPECCGKPMGRIFTAANVTPDLTPYFTVAADKETGRCQHIRSRKQHREFLKRNGYEEVGNDKPKPTRQSPDAAAFMWGKPD